MYCCARPNEQAVAGVPREYEARGPPVDAGGHGRILRDEAEVRGGGHVRREGARQGPGPGVPAAARAGLSDPELLQRWFPASASFLLRASRRALARALKTRRHRGAGPETPESRNRRCFIGKKWRALRDSNSQPSGSCLGRREILKPRRCRACRPHPLQGSCLSWSTSGTQVRAHGSIWVRALW